ncbi:hypothetical protein UPYG_G00010420 [Umbra pygmaea]|uniref:DNA endonuclease Ctp1 N-terminal domain-containing protein n=1 Tax=Umbra pygmaea TaxID=75934 RepID=A0ABD0XIG0_UMBPY
MSLEGFNDLLHKLREAHERELEGWHEKFQELTNKKGCSDTKRMEELFNKNQHLREQQRLLTQNIKQLENRLRAGLCDRCTVTQDVAKRRQQEYETSQIQSLQHISILAGEMNTMRKENHRLQEEVRRLREALEGQSGHSSSQDATQRVRQSVDLSPSATPHITTAIRSLSQPPEGTTAGLSVPIVKTETDHGFLGGTDHTLPDGRHLRGWNGKQSIVHKPHRPLSMSPPIPSSLRSEQSPARCHNRQKRSSSEDTHRPFIHPLLVQKNNAPPSSFSSSLPGNDKQSRNPVHAPVPYRPLPVKSARLSIPWPLPEHSDWVTLATSVGDGLVINPNPNSNLAHFANLQTFHQQSSNNSVSRKLSTGQDWPKPSRSPQAGLTRSLSKPEEEAVAQVQNTCRAPSPWKDVLDQAERVFVESLKETDAPLDLSDTGRSKIKSPQDSKPSPTLQNIKDEVSNRTTESSHQTEASSSTPPSNQHRQSPNNHTLKEEGQSEMEEADCKDQTTGMEFGDRKVPVLTISLRPVVLLEALNSGLQRQLSSNGKTALPSGSSSEEQDVDNPLSRSESSHCTKRKMDSDTEISHQKERRMNLSNAVTMEKSQSESDDGSKMNSH